MIVYDVLPPRSFRPGAALGRADQLWEPELRPYGNDWPEPLIIRVSRFRKDLLRTRDMHWCLGTPLISEGRCEEFAKLTGACLDRAEDPRGNPWPLFRLRGEMVPEPRPDLFFFRTPDRPYSLLVGSLGLEFLRADDRLPCCAFERGPDEPSAWDDSLKISKRDIARLGRQGRTDAEAREEMERFLEFRRTRGRQGSWGRSEAG